MSVISQFSSGGVKSVQSGVASVAGTATITSVNVAKSVVLSVSKGSAGTVAATGTIAATYVSSGWNPGDYGNGMPNSATRANETIAATTISGGTTNLTTKQFSAVITNPTTITVDGPCEWQVVEYY